MVFGGIVETKRKKKKKGLCAPSSCHIVIKFPEIDFLVKLKQL